MSESLDWLVASERDRLFAVSAPCPAQSDTIKYSELPKERAADDAARNWNYYLSEASRLLAEGHEGRWLIVHEGAIVGIWDTEDEARTVASVQFLMEPVLIHRIRDQEPVIPVPTFLFRCRT